MRGAQRIIFALVPLESSAWKPEMTPQPIVMNANGKSVPANTGLVEPMNRVTAGMRSGGNTRRIATPSVRIVPTFMNADR